MKVNAKVVGYGPDPETTKALVNIIVEFSGPTETMTLTVIVPNEGDEAALKEQGNARAKDFVLQFAADRKTVQKAREGDGRRDRISRTGESRAEGSRSPCGRGPPVPPLAALN